MNINKLPKWAQDHIKQLERDNHYVRAEIHILKDLPESPFKHRILAGSSDPIGDIVNLPEGYEILIDLNGTTFSFRLDENQLGQPSIYVNCHNKTVLVAPIASNALYLTPG